MQPVVRITAIIAHLNNNLELKLLYGRKKMRKFLLYSSALVVSGLLSSTAEAGCIQTPSCSSLGYTSTTACEGGLKCPWGNAWFCNVGGGSSTPDYSNCMIGDILYSDKSCDPNVVASKKPIGVVFDRAHRLAMALDTARKAWSDEYAVEHFDVPSLPNITTDSAAIKDWQGKNNTRLVLEHCKTNVRCPAFEYVNSYKTEGTLAGDWYLPAAGELHAIYQNKDVLNMALGTIGGTKLPLDGHWSSSETSRRYAWEQDFSNGNVNTYEKDDYYYYVRPVLAF